MSADELIPESADLIVYAARLTRTARSHIRDAPLAGIRVLSLLDEHGPSGIGELATRDQCSQPTMSGVVAGLLNRGWVDKQRRRSDARVTLVSLTDLGREMLTDLRTHNARIVADAVADTPSISAEDLTTAVRVLREVLDHSSQKGNQ